MLAIDFAHHSHHLKYHTVLFKQLDANTVDRVNAGSIFPGSASKLFLGFRYASTVFETGQIDNFVTKSHDQMTKIYIFYVYYAIRPITNNDAYNDFCA